jgi:hypothetical protein
MTSATLPTNAECHMCGEIVADTRGADPVYSATVTVSVKRGRKVASEQRTVWFCHMDCAMDAYASPHRSISYPVRGA